ncbi:hypothetical protein CcaCcLH18_12783 [Colletotrichum camelliae]|nr:hypothetical protein CcaCcLH18_12783 [Colletotrichum camelliae]
MAPEQYFHRVSRPDAYRREAKPEGDWLKTLNKLGASKWGRPQLAALRVLVVKTDTSLLPSLGEDEAFLRASSILRFDEASESDFQQEDDDDRESLHVLFKLVKGPPSDHRVTRSVRTEYALRREPLGSLWAAMSRLCMSVEIEDSIDPQDEESGVHHDDETSVIGSSPPVRGMGVKREPSLPPSIDDGGLSLIQDFGVRLSRVAILETKRHLGEISDGEPKLSDERFAQMIGQALSMRLAQAAWVGPRDTIFIIAAARYYMRFLEVHITQDYVDQLEVSEDHQKAAAEFIKVNSTKWFDLRSERPRNHAVINIAGIVSQAFKAVKI